VSPSPEDDEQLPPAERRVREFLAALGADAPRPDAVLASVVVRKARWQRTVRGPLRAAGGLAAALVEGVRMAVGGRRGESR
jgi:hypothetical protein